MLRLEEVVKRYDGSLAIDRLSLHVPAIAAPLPGEPLPPALLASLSALSPEIAAMEGRITLAGQAVAYKPEILRRLLDGGVEIYHLSERRATIEEIYLEATGE